MHRRAVFVLACAVALLAAAAPASARSGNATQAYLSADYALVRAAGVREAASQAALQGLLGQVKRECPNAAYESPQETDSEQLSNELVGDMIIVGTRPDAQAIARFARAVAPLRFSNRSLTSAIRSYATQLKALAAMSPSNLCSDVRSWVASGYKTLPAATNTFNQAYKVVNVAIGELPGALAAYEQPSQRPLVRRIEQLELKIADFEARAVETWAAVMDTLDLQP